MSETHALRVFFDQDQLCAEVICRAAPDADCRLSCDEGCEDWGPITRDDDGIWHYVVDDGTGHWQDKGHRMHVVDYCNVCAFINDDGAAEFGSGTFEIAEVPIKPQWEGDHYTWARIAEAAPMTALDPRVTLTDVLAAHAWRPMMHSQGCSCGWHASLSHPDLHRDHLAERIEEHIAARLAPIRALADEWEQPDVWQKPLAWWWESSHRLRAALDATGADLRASQDHDGAEGQGEGERTGEGDPCAHDWVIDRPESDTWQCIDCDHEGAGVR